VTDATPIYVRKHARDCVRRASGLVLTRHSETEPVPSIFAFCPESPVTGIWPVPRGVEL